MDINSFTMAGSETSASILSGCMYYLCKHPNMMERLRREIRTTFSNDADVTSYKCTKIEYLNNVIDEAFRLYPPFVTNLPRLVPKGGGTVDGHILPEGVCGS